MSRGVLLLVLRDSVSSGSLILVPMWHVGHFH